MATDWNTPQSPSPGPGFSWNPVSGQWVPNTGNNNFTGPGNQWQQQNETDAYLSQLGINPGSQAAQTYASQGSLSPGQYGIGTPGGLTSNANTPATGATPLYGPNATQLPGSPSTPTANSQGNQTLGGLANSGGTGQTVTGGQIAGGTASSDPWSTPAAAGQGMAMSSFLNPMAQYMQDWANKGLQSTYAAQGDLLSGPAMQGISQFNQNAALNNAWQPAFNNYLANNQQQYGMALNDQTIPFQQQMQLAQLGLQGQQGSSSLAATLAALLSNNMTNIGQAQAGGSIGTGNAINSSIANAISNALQQNYMNMFAPKQPGT